MLKQNAAEVERSLIGVGTEVATNFVGKADEISAAMHRNSTELTRLLDEKSSGLLTAIATKGGQFSLEIERAAEGAVKAIDAKAFAFGQTMMDNSSELARIINEASATATTLVNRTLKELQDGTKNSVTQATMLGGRDAARPAAVDRERGGGVEETAVATVSELLETHGTVRSDTTSLLERLREANGLLQEVLGGAHTNLNSIEHVLSTRVAEFVSTIGDILENANSTSGKMDEHVSAFYGMTSKVLGDLGDLAVKFEDHGRSLADTMATVEQSHRQSLTAVTDRQTTFEGMINMLNERSDDLDARLKRFSGTLESSSTSPRTAPATSRGSSPRRPRRARGRSPTSTTPSAPRPTSRARSRSMRCAACTSRWPTTARVCSSRPPPTPTRCSSRRPSASPTSCRACARWRRRCSTSSKPPAGIAPRRA